MSLWARVYEERRAIVLPLLAILLVNVALLVVVVWPLRANVAAGQSAAQSARTALTVARQADQRAAAAAVRRMQAESSLLEFRTRILPRDFPSATRTSTVWLQRAARDAGLDFRGSRFDTKEMRDSSLAQVGSTVTLVGRYPDLRRFLAAVERSREFIVINRVELAQASELGANSSGLLEIVLDVSTYYVAAGVP